MTNQQPQRRDDQMARNTNPNALNSAEREKRLAAALRHIKYTAVSLADAQVIALEALASRDEVAQQPQGQAVSDADVLTRAIQRLNVNPYSMTKQECITLLQELRDDILALRDKPTVKDSLTVERVPLSDEQIAEISVECAIKSPSDIVFARAIEAAHGITAKEQGNG